MNIYTTALRPLHSWWLFYVAAIAHVQQQKNSVNVLVYFSVNKLFSRATK